MSRPRIAITCGEPAGIGPEIALRAALEVGDADCLLIGDASQIKSLATLIAPARVLRMVQSAAELIAHQNTLCVLDAPLVIAPNPGQLDARNGLAVLKMLDMAIDAAVAEDVDAIVTAPVQKRTINDAGHAFTGHTEYLAERTGTNHVVMMLAGDTDDGVLRVALATTHLALSDVPAAITTESLMTTLTIMHDDLVHRFGIPDPRILVTGLNPHAGEGGYLGREEIEQITPAITRARDLGWQVSGPYPADTLFQPRYLRDADAVLAMYHDQGLPVLKYATFGHGVNITLGLPIIRTSVDHGTALDLAAAGLGHADHTSMREAIRVACQMVRASR
ncbi:MAG: 4-hydroxythreonine-4-phosphate dehydrogenase PdxA [Oxalobacteraceae bacterium]|nr:4-hydroxythreonine-4-phosphate dehydrogenase PdxA [Oxalobacteraceae bacterium]